MMKLRYAWIVLHCLGTMFLLNGSAKALSARDDMNSSKPLSEARFQNLLCALDSYEYGMQSCVLRWTKFEQTSSAIEGGGRVFNVSILRSRRGTQQVVDLSIFENRKKIKDTWLVDTAENGCFQADNLLKKVDIYARGHAFEDTPDGNFLFGPVGTPDRSFRARIGMAFKLGLVYESLTTAGLIYAAGGGEEFIFDENHGYYPIVQAVYLKSWTRPPFFERIVAEGLEKQENGTWWPRRVRLQRNSKEVHAALMGSAESIYVCTESRLHLREEEALAAMKKYEIPEGIDYVDHVKGKKGKYNPASKK